MLLRTALVGLQVAAILITIPSRERKKQLVFSILSVSCWRTSSLKAHHFSTSLRKHQKPSSKRQKLLRAAEDRAEWCSGPCMAVALRKTEVDKPPLRKVKPNSAQASVHDIPWCWHHHLRLRCHRPWSMVSCEVYAA